MNRIQHPITVIGNLLSVYINKVLLAHSHAYSCPYYLWLLLCYNGVVVKETEWLTKPEIFPVWFFQEKDFPASVLCAKGEKGMGGLAGESILG